MSPVATSARDDLLEHPDQAFDAYRADGVESVLCEEKHMGSRAVLLVCRSSGDAQASFGLPGAAGAIWTRTGRPFFAGPLGSALIDQLRGAAAKAGLFDELGTSWLLLDAELVPWNVKAGAAAAGPVRRRRRGRPGLAPGCGLDPGAGLSAAGLPEIGALLERTRARLANAEAFTAAYLRYCWATDGLAGVRVAPFQLLASEGAVYHERPHLWHLGLADRLAAAGPELIATTRRVEVETGDPASVAAATRWWEDLTAAGGEGMVVKPAANLTRGARPAGLVQPGLKVRGREYLRIIYGPDYTEPANLARLRQRGLSHKRSLALREYALGLEALDRVARGEPLWRVHECVFAVLALESEPVDPRLAAARAGYAAYVRSTRRAVAPCGPLARSPDAAGSSRCAATRQKSPAVPVIADSASGGPNRHVSARVRGGQLAPHRDRRLAGHAQRVRQRAVRQPGDMPQPFGVGKLDAERPGDVQAVRPVLGQPRGRQRGGLHRPGHPLQRLVRVGRPDRGQPRLPGPLPPREHLRGRRPLHPDRFRRPVVHRVPGRRAQPRAQLPVRGRRLDTLLGLGQVQHHVGDRPARGPRRRQPLRLVQPEQDLLQPFLFRRQVRQRCSYPGLCHTKLPASSPGLPKTRPAPPSRQTRPPRLASRQTMIVNSFGRICPELFTIMNSARPGWVRKCR